MRDIKENKRYICDKAIKESVEVKKLREERYVPTRKWVKPLFDREIINIK